MRPAVIGHPFDGAAPPSPVAAPAALLLELDRFGRCVGCSSSAGPSGPGLIGASVRDGGAALPADRGAFAAALGGRGSSARCDWRGRTFSSLHLPRVDAEGAVVGVSIVAQDVTEREREAAAAAADARRLRASEARLRSLVTNMRDIVLCHGAEGSAAHGYDGGGAALYGADVQRLAGTRDERGRARIGNWYEAVHPDDRAAYLEAERRRKERHEDYTLEYRIYHPVTGALRWMREVAWVTRDAGRGGACFDSYILDVTEQKEAELALTESRERYRQLIEAAPVAILICAGGRCAYANPRAVRLLGGGLEGRPLAELVDAGDHAALARDLGAMLEGSGSMVAREVDCLRLDGARVPVEASAVAISERGLTAVQLVLVDLTERRRAEALRHEARHDALTGLPNRALLMERLAQAVAAAKRGRSGLALMLLDFDRFKGVNDGFGHAAGDELLRQAARRIRLAVREVDTVARLGGDEFALLQLDARDPEAVALVAERVLEAMVEPFRIDGEEIRAGLSVGVAAFPPEGASADTLLRQADLALYRAKAEGRGRVCFFEPALDTAMEARRRLEVDLRQALADDELHLVYQPQLDLATRKVVGAEALLRRSSAARGPAAPERMIPVAEATGMIQPLGPWVLDRACAQARAWQDQGLDLRVAVNVSPAQLRRAEFPETVVDALARHALPPERLCLELSESLLVDPSLDRLGEVLETVAGAGVQLAVDDFGAGSSPLRELKRLPARDLKIDRKLVRGVGADDDSEAIVRATIGIAHGLGKRVIAEGVETESQHGFLASLGCDRGQGLAYAGPERPELLGAYLAANR